VNIKVVIKVLGFLMLVCAGCLLLPALVSLLYRENDWIWFLASAGIGAVVGGGILLLLRDTPDLRVREGFAVVAFGWFFIGLLGALPFWFSGQIPSFTDAAFESISGFTALLHTGSGAWESCCWRWPSCPCWGSEACSSTGRRFPVRWPNG